MKILKKFFFWLVVIPVFSYFILCMITTWLTMRSDSKVNNLEIVSWEDTIPVNIKIPVQYVDRKMVLTKSAAIRTKDGVRYSFRVDPENPNIYWITKMCPRFGGKYWIRYKISDPEIEKQLIELYQTLNEDGKP